MKATIIMGSVLGLKKRFHNKGTLCEQIDHKDIRMLFVEIKAIIIMGGILGAVRIRGMGGGEFDPKHFNGLCLNVMNHSLLLVFTESVSGKFKPRGGEGRDGGGGLPGARRQHAFGCDKYMGCNRFRLPPKVSAPYSEGT